MNFFDQDHPEKSKNSRPIPAYSINFLQYNEEQCTDCHLTNISLIQMKINRIYKDQQIYLWIVTQPEPKNLIDGTTYFIVHDQYDFHIRLSKIFLIFFSFNKYISLF